VARASASSRRKAPQPQRSGQRVIRMKDIHFAYGQNVVYSGVDFEAERGQRIVLVGPNGAGKSTLLKLLAANVTPSQGERELGHNVKAGYFSQYRVDNSMPAAACSTKRSTRRRASRSNSSARCSAAFSFAVMTCSKKSAS
jgi:ATPase subunit of ABC transporter with duplicated ATPase domains